MKRIYICAPYRGDIETNRRRALAYARQVKNAGYLQRILRGCLGAVTSE